MTQAEVREGPPDLPTPSDIDEGVLRVFDELDAPEERGEDKGFVLTDAGQADWACRKLAAVRAAIAQADELADRQLSALQAMLEAHLEPIRTWHDTRTGRLADEASFWEGLLALYHRDIVLTEDPKAKTVKLPHGTLSARKSPDQWKFGDEEFMAWARDIAPELIRTKEEPDKALIKKTLKPNQFGQAVFSLPEGDIPALGVVVEPGEVTFSVSTEEAS